MLAVSLDQRFFQRAYHDFLGQLAVILDRLHGIHKHFQFHLPVPLYILTDKRINAIFSGSIVIFFLTALAIYSTTIPSSS